MKVLEKLRKQNQNKLTTKTKMKQKINKKKNTHKAKRNSAKSKTDMTLYMWRAGVLPTPQREHPKNAPHKGSTQRMLANPKGLASLPVHSESSHAQVSDFRVEGSWHRNCKTIWIQGLTLEPLVVTCVDPRDLPLWYPG